MQPMPVNQIFGRILMTFFMLLLNLQNVGHYASQIHMPYDLSIIVYTTKTEIGEQGMRNCISLNLLKIS